MESEDVAPFGQIYSDRVFRALSAVVLSELGAESAGLDANHRIDLGIEVCGATKHLGRNLILLNGRPGVVEDMFGQVTEQFT